MIALADYGIYLPREKIGWQGTACPECAKVKRRSHDDSLGVETFPDGGYRWSCQRCGWEGCIWPDDRTRHTRAFTPRHPPPPAEPPKDRAGLLTAALALWHRSTAITSDTVAASYLEARGCALPHPDGDLRSLVEHRHPGGWRGPCLVALVTDAVTGEPMTLHRTWIQADGRKAPIDKPRLLWPGLPKAGGVVRLWPDAEVTLALCLAEGLETALTAAAGFGLAWSTIDAGNLAVLPVLSGVESLTIIADHDEPNARTGVRPGSAAADECSRRWLAAGVEVRIWMAPIEGADFNDVAGRAA